MRECHITRLSLFAPLIVVQRDTASETWVAPFRGEKATNCPAAVRSGSKPRTYYERPGWTATLVAPRRRCSGATATLRAHSAFTIRAQLGPH